MKIAIDAGHGPNTKGKCSPDNKLREFMFNEKVANKMKAILTNKGYVVIFTHDSLTDVPLKERINLANNLKVDVLISIHANAFGTTWNEANGIETYCYIGSQGKSKSLANIVQNELVHFTKLKNRGVKQANFAILRETKMPSILVECGFMTNKREAKLLQSDDYATLCAEAIVSGFLKWKTIHKKVTEM